MLIKNRKSRFSIKLLSVFISLVLLLSLMPANILLSAFAAEQDGLLVATMADLHYYATEDLGSKGDALTELLNQTNTQVLQLEGLTTAALHAVQEHAVANGLKYLFLAGDLTLNGEKKAHEELAAKLRQFEADSGVKVYLINGNHDVNHTGATSYKNDVKDSSPELRTSPQDFVDIYSDLVYGQQNVTRYIPPEGRFGGSLSYAVSLEGGYRLIAIDGGKYSFDNTTNRKDEAETGGNIPKDLMNWVAAQAAQAKANGETVIGLTHWNAVETNYVQKNVMQGFVYDNMEDTAEKLADAGVNFLMTGHSHTNDIATTVSDNGETLYNIQTAALSEFPNTFRETHFSKAEDSSVTARFDVRDVDCEIPVVVDGVAFAQPYRETTSFNITYKNGDATAFLAKILNASVDKLFDQIEKKGGLLSYLEEAFGFNLQQMLFENLLVDFPIPGTNINLIDSKNILSFVEDIETQVYNKYIADRAYTHSVLYGIAQSLATHPVSDLPCTEFLSKYGFGGASAPGTFGDLVFSALAYMYEGNENNLEDAFIQDVIAKSASGEFASDLFDLLKDVLFKGLLQDEILAGVNLNISKLLASYGPNVSYVAELALRLLLNNNLSALNVINTLLGKNILPQYGTSIDNIADNLIAKYMTPSQFEGLGYQFDRVISGCTSDDTLDYDTEYTYSGKVEVPATTENYRLPSMATVVFGSEIKKSYNITWYTKASVTGTDIELVKANGSAPPLFSSKPSIGDNIKAYSTYVTKEYPGVDLGITGFFPYELTLTKHTLQLTNLDPNQKYYFRIGDAAKDWWSEVGMLNAFPNDDSFRFLFTTDAQSQTPYQYQDTWGSVMKAAFEKYNDISFVVHGGDMTDNPNNINQWQWCLDSAQAQLLSTVTVPVSGNHEESAANAVLNHFALANYPKQNTETGVYYSFEYENAYIAVLNTNDLTGKGALSDEQVAWLKADIQKSGANWKIVALHKSPYTTGTHANDEDVTALRAQLAKLMPELSVDLVLSGHDHIYLRTDVLKNNQVTFCDKNIIELDGMPFETKFGPDGTVFVVGGTAGAKHYNDAVVSIDFPKPEKEVPTASPVFSSVRIEKDVLVFEAYSVDGDSVSRADVFALEKGYEEYLSGDLDYNHMITAADARLALRASAKLDKLTATDKIVADVDGDGNVTAADARLILRASAKLQPLQNQYVTIKG
ncbi:MAG: metallophosphoesterase [Oscillospiraceae bacterium]|jgi:3',5'-cyclic AMP phosphodiesterase CpdA|nr:metallophosphoesterase [Oscillospiraceae bacterium]